MNTHINWIVYLLTDASTTLSHIRLHHRRYTLVYMCPCVRLLIHARDVVIDNNAVVTNVTTLVICSQTEWRGWHGDLNIRTETFHYAHLSKTDLTYNVHSFV